MGRRLLCIHTDDAVRARLLAAAPDGFAPAVATSVEDGEVQHARTAFDVVAVELDRDAATVRRLRSWHPEPAVVTVGADATAADVALASGAHDHLQQTAATDAMRSVITRSWHRHRALRTRRAGRAAPPDIDVVRQRLDQLVSLTTAARELIGIDEPPHTTVRSLLQQGRELGLEATELSGRARAPERRQELDLAMLAREAWDARETGGAVLDVDIPPLGVHGHPTMVRTALVVLVTHALRDPAAARHVVVDAEVLADAVRLRVHDDGAPVPLGQRAALVSGGDPDHTPMLMAVEHVAAHHGGTAWVEDSDRIENGTAAVIELPRRALPR